jgi:hypothetical protein
MSTAPLNAGFPHAILSEHAPFRGHAPLEGGGHLSLQASGAHGISSQHFVAFDHIVLDPARFPCRFVIDIQPTLEARVHLCFVPHLYNPGPRIPGPGNLGPQVIFAAAIDGTPGETVSVFCHLREGGGRIIIARGGVMRSQELNLNNRRIHACVRRPALVAESPIGGRFAAAVIENDGTSAAAS